MLTEGTSFLYSQNYVTPVPTLEERLTDFFNTITLRNRANKLTIIYQRGEAYSYDKNTTKTITKNISIKRGFITTKQNGFLILKRGNSERLILLPNSILQIDRQAYTLMEGSLYVNNQMLPILQKKQQKKIFTIHSALGSYIYNEGAFVMGIIENKLNVFTISGIGVFKKISYQTLMRKGDQIFLDGDDFINTTSAKVKKYVKTYDRLFNLYQHLIETTTRYQYNTPFLRQRINSIIAAYRQSAIQKQQLTQKAKQDELKTKLEAKKPKVRKIYKVIITSVPKEVDIFYKAKKIATKTPFTASVKEGTHSFQIVNPKAKTQQFKTIITSDYANPYAEIPIDVNLLFKKPNLVLTVKDDKGILLELNNIINGEEGMIYELQDFEKKKNKYSRNLDLGDYELTVKKKGYQIYRWNFTASVGGKTIRKDIELKKLGEVAFLKKMHIPKTDDAKAQSLNRPSGISANQYGFFVGSLQRGLVYWFDLEGNYRNTFDNNAYQFSLLSDIATHNNNLLISDTRENQLVRFNYNVTQTNWKYHSLVFPQTESNPLKLPYGIAAFKDLTGIANTYANQVLIINKEGKTSILQDKAIIEPIDMVFLSANLFVIAQWGKKPSLLKIASPINIVQNIKLKYIPGLITKDDDNNIYVLNPKGREVMMYNDNLEKITSIPISKEDAVTEPYGIAYYNNNLYITFSDGNSIVVYEKNYDKR